MRAIGAVIGWVVLAIVLIFVFTILINVALVRNAQSHDFWINNSGYKSTVDGSHCCGKNDCVSFKEGEVKATPSGYRLPSGEVVPLSEAQVGEDGYYWRCKLESPAASFSFALSGQPDHPFNSRSVD